MTSNYLKKRIVQDSKVTSLKRPGCKFTRLRKKLRRSLIRSAAYFIRIRPKSVRKLTKEAALRKKSGDVGKKAV